MHGDLFRGGEKDLQLIMKNSLQIGNGDLVVTFSTEIFGCPVPHIHFSATGAPGDIAEGVGREFAGEAVDFALLLDDLVDLIPERFTDDWLTGDLTPFGLGFLFGTPITVLLDAVEVVNARSEERRVGKECRL